jgi:outer membrane protein assembly factor BamE (lipoprotein component of BamABCDE complex)
MSRSRKRSLVLTVVVLGCIGCSSYRYMRETTPDIEHSRKEYVDTNPGSRYTDDILAGRVREGMSRLQVRITWGDPDQVAPGTLGSEVWSYQELDPNRGTSVYNLQFQGELLANVRVDHAGTPMSTNIVEDPKTTKTRDQPAGSSAATRKPGGVLW